MAEKALVPADWLVGSVGGRCPHRPGAASLMNPDLAVEGLAYLAGLYLIVLGVESVAMAFFPL